jgi:hypothetical protein
VVPVKGTDLVIFRRKALKIIPEFFEFVEAFIRRSATFRYREVSAPSLTRICAQADDKLFNKILHDERHLLHSLLPPRRSQHYSLRQRRHNFQLPTRMSVSLQEK